MRFFPHEEFYIKTNISQQEAQQRLIANIDRPKTAWNIFNPPDRYFIGFEVDYEFEIKQNVDYRDYFVPQIIGVIEVDGANAQIYVQMALQPTVKAVAWLFLGGVGFAGLVITISFITSSDFSFGMFVPYGMVLFIYLIIYISFKHESEKAKDFLTKLFNGNIENA